MRREFVQDRTELQLELPRVDLRTSGGREGTRLDLLVEPIHRHEPAQSLRRREREVGLEKGYVDAKLDGSLPP